MARWLRWSWLLALPAVPLLQTRLDARFGTYRAQEEMLYVRSGQQWRRLLPGFVNAVADIYWLRTVQYYGGKRLDQDSRFDLLQPLLEITADLDPRFETVYSFGAMFLSEPAPLGAGKPDVGIAFMERGVEELPRAWLLQQQLGYFTWLYLHDGERAAASVLRATKLPGAPTWLSFLAADLAEKGGDRERSRRMWQQLYETLDGPMRDNAKFWLQYMQAEDELIAWRRVLAAYRQSHGTWPASLAATRANLSDQDPSGKAWVYSPEDGSLKPDMHSELSRPDLQNLAFRLSQGLEP